MPASTGGSHHSPSHARHSWHPRRWHTWHTRRHHRWHPRRSHWKARWHEGPSFWLHLICSRHATACNLATSWPRCYFCLLWTSWWWSLRHQRHNSLSSQHHEAKSSLHFLLIIFAAFGLDLPKLLAVCQYHIHVLIESHEGADKHSLI